METAEGKNRPVAANFQFLKIFCPFGTASCWGVPASNPAGNEYGKLELVGAKPLHLAMQDRSVAQKPHWGFHCSASLHKREFSN